MFAITCEGLADVPSGNQVVGSAIALDNNDGLTERKLRSSATTTPVEDGPDDEERAAFSIKEGFSKLNNIFKKNPDVTKTLQKAESTKLTAKEVAAVRSAIAKSPDKMSRKELLQLLGVLVGVFVVFPAVAVPIVHKLTEP
ncbi:hypothetical protein PHYSODRAFT_288711 [Phytophthora sojae]|uniref:Uncharacterized protein n=1 Tax=Phytophthora sojae (strain P6497) TaxID=1094619 RepID=G5A750_PHYSP|nr:hypothetical protein PHYSODRAFT_288711 [Phytophthora sojae]EGZ09155.1 hypothetical protein PHYSODRAFT_288711 [Phytophthora sojae]|eukprot:XP_009535788.1 hypothetical protein PHYSODRAFT_288711 [Phytophthora sojae]